jgi:CRISPR locus-related DNA-binding protein
MLNVETLAVFSLGFDERFLVKHAIMEGLGVRGHDMVLAVYPRTEESEKVKRAIEALNKMIRQYELNLRVEELQVEMENFWTACGLIRARLEEAILKVKPKYMQIVLGGGMRIMVVALLLSAAAARFKPDTSVFVYREDLKGSVKFPLDLLKVEAPSVEELKVLKKIKEKKRTTLSELARELGLSKTSTFRRISSLANEGYVKVVRKGRGSFIELEEKAKLWFNI